MQNGRNRIAAHGRTKAGPPVKAAKRTTRKPRLDAEPKPSLPPAFPQDVAVAMAPGNRVPPLTVAKPKTPRKPRTNPAQARRRKPGRKKRAVAREAATMRHKALVPSPRKRAAAPRHPETPAVIHLADLGGPAVAMALPLPVHSEPLIVARAADATTELRRDRSLAAPRKGLVAAIADWIRSARRLSLIGLLPRKSRAALPKAPTHVPAAADTAQQRRELMVLRQRQSAREAIEALRKARSSAEA